MKSITNYKILNNRKPCGFKSELSAGTKDVQLTCSNTWAEEIPIFADILITLFFVITNSCQ